ncbi:glucose-1-phosphate thymidylyltransferase RfbA [Paenibacillus sp. SYP-B4298]|uniref:glucose-1-phosphate thymidylyltransferase RfbA n=1 Tax=Paenibacillus sp. SYP-B4298 TaxID=2996034 RepID=UPI0022DD706D|nr:glucose-1-phosphate thymidylyltransferase RfbA [Paenibacillus sp. SYP-B4298]
MKGIILAGGSGSRLFPITKGTNKHLLPIHGKPMIYYPLSILMVSGIREILVVSTPDDIPRFERLLGDGSQWGMSFQYKVQHYPEGVAQVFGLGEEFIGSGSVTLILGDNIFFGKGIYRSFQQSGERGNGATVFCYPVDEPERFGVIEFDSSGKVASIEEKPHFPKSNMAVTGLYRYDNRVIDIAKTIQPSSRNELEITSVNEVYREWGDLGVEVLGADMTWLDTGTHTSFIQAQLLIEQAEERDKTRFGIPEVMAYWNGWISQEQLYNCGARQIQSEYGMYLMQAAQSLA